MTALSIDIWGPKAWGFLHACTFTYPEHPSDLDRVHMYNLLNSLGYVLPCTVCRKHFRELFEESIRGPTSHVFDNRLQVSSWLVDAHNEVNARNAKPLLSYEDVEKMYVKTSSVCAVTGVSRASESRLPPSARVAVYFGSSVLILVICMCLSRFVFKCQGITCQRTEERE